METYHGYVRTPADAIRLFEACRLGILPRVQRRLSEKERQSIRSGSVFVWDEREAGMRRWTDGKSWSASRVSGSFLTYREMEGKRGGGFSTNRRGGGKTPDSGRGSDEDQDDGEPEGYRYKADGLMKQSFSITTSSGQHLHLISYYSRPQPGQPELQQPTNDPALRGIVPVKGMYPESSMGEANSTPALTRAPMQQPPYMAPQPGQQPYASYGQPGYGWPPSPAATPPYHHYAAPYPPNVPQQYQPHASHPGLPLPHYPQAPIYEQRAPLPPLPAKPSYPSSSSPHYSHPALPRAHESPREQHLQAAAQSAISDARSSSSSHSHQVALPSLGAVTNGPPGSSLAAISTPPSRTMSVSPPRNSRPEGTGLSTLHAVLHHTPAASESGSVKPSSAASSPRVSGACGLEKGGVSEDARALRMLDRKFCI
ncbi:Gti1/Pac2 family-domain-containing protein [Fusarium flagelliforme]|uniref:Camp-independent regulatory protein pac2 n=1 Tax=Fusarium flagelliforme TaxID=2675880 RepID=A0A395M8U1_9HYPO|nr:Gti1/Pac2 family-domain-containing protein [Fusarium flagelliforme]KAH7182988.1 Gti1/Pac2 family-domain-containing protein [Fusarium flagelliforme]RFN44266.1 camp-independent regulatory protein pac2 [Fusarium flagelliforme]